MFPAIVGALLAPAKAGVYAPMLAFLLLIPVRKAGSLPKYLGLVAMGAIPAAVTLGSWTIVSLHQLPPIFGSVPAIKAPVERSLLWGIGGAPLQYLWLVAKTTTVLYRGYVAQFIGVLGWFGAVLPRSIIVAYLSLIFAIAIMEDPGKSGVGVPGKIVVGLVAVFVYVFIMTTQYISFSRPPRGGHPWLPRQIPHSPGAGLFSLVPCSPTCPEIALYFSHPIRNSSIYVGCHSHDSLNCHKQILW